MKSKIKLSITRKIHERNFIERRLDSFARLFEQGMICAAVCFDSKGNLLIATNKLFQGSKINNNRSILESFLEYFSGLIENGESAVNLEIEINLLLITYLNKLQLAYQNRSYLKPNTSQATTQTIIEFLLKNGSGMLASDYSLYNYFKKYHQDRLTIDGNLLDFEAFEKKLESDVRFYNFVRNIRDTYNIIFPFLRDFNKVKKILIRSINSDNFYDLKLASFESKKSRENTNISQLASKNIDLSEIEKKLNYRIKGFKLLLIGENDEHAEMKILGYLLETDQLISKKTEKNDQKSKTVYIAISKLTCSNCHFHISIVQNFLKNLKQENISVNYSISDLKYGGTHSLEIGKHIIPKFFLKKSYLTKGKIIAFPNQELKIKLKNKFYRKLKIRDKLKNFYRQIIEDEKSKLYVKNNQIKKTESIKNFEDFLSQLIKKNFEKIKRNIKLVRSQSSSYEELLNQLIEVDKKDKIDKKRIKTVNVAVDSATNSLPPPKKRKKFINQSQEMKGINITSDHYLYQNHVLQKILNYKRNHVEVLKLAEGKKFLCVGDKNAADTLPCDRYGDKRFYVALAEVTDIGNEQARFHGQSGEINQAVSYGIDFLSLIGANDNVVYTVCDILLQKENFLNLTVALCQKEFFTICRKQHNMLEENIKKMDLYKKIGRCSSINAVQKLLKEARQAKRRYTVFSEILPMILKSDAVVRQARIILPLNKNNIHWVTLELVLFYFPDQKKIYVEILQHDPYGGGQLSAFYKSKLNLKLKNLLVDLLTEHFPQEEKQELSVEIKHIESPYLRRQQDDTSCGAITLEDVILLAQGQKSLDNRLYPKGVPILRQYHQEIFNLLQIANQKSNDNNGESSNYQVGFFDNLIINQLKNRKENKFSNSTALNFQRDNKKSSPSRYGLFKIQHNLKQQHANQLFLKTIPEYFELGLALGKGDCFYDAAAQALNQLQQKETYSTKILRLICHGYAVTLDKACNNDYKHKDNWLGRYFKDDLEYNSYIANVQYTAEECEQGFGLNNNKLAVWGEQHIDAVILCKKLNIKIHVIGVQEVPIDNEGKKTKQIIIHRLADPSGSKNTDFIDYNDKNLVHLAVYNNHFVPLLKKAPNQKSSNSIQQASQSFQDLDKTASFESLETILENRKKRNDIIDDSEESSANNPNSPATFHG